MRNGRTLRSTTLAALALASLAACTKKAVPVTPLTADALQTAKGQYLGGLDCDPLVPNQCGFPVPSNTYLVHGPTGLSVQFGASTLPTIPGGQFTSPTPYTQSDGFSPGQAAMAYFPGATTLWSGGSDDGATCTNSCAAGSCAASSNTCPNGTLNQGVCTDQCGIGETPVSSMTCSNGSACTNTCLSGKCSAAGTCMGSLPTPLSIADSLKPDCPTVLMEADTGVLVPHWVDLDQSETDGSPQCSRTIMIRPAIRLKDQTRYIVAFRNLVDEYGNVVEPSPTFKALRDGDAPPTITVNSQKITDPSVTPRRALYADIFAKLAKAGVQQSNLQLAWDYTTSSKTNNTAALISMRDQALAVVGAAGPLYNIPTTTESIPIGDSVNGITMNPDQYTAMAIAGTFSVPVYISTPQPPQTASDPQCRICRDAACSPANFGNTAMMPVQNMAIKDMAGHAGFTDYPFLVQIPKSVAASGKPAPILLNGHGLLGNRTEGQGGWLSNLANDKGYIAVSINLTGFDHNAVNAAEASVQGDISAFLQMIDPQQQGITNQVLVIRMLKGAFAQDPRFFFKNGVPDTTGTSVIDTTTAFYRGDSQGGIMGGTFMAISVDTPRGYLGEPGMPYQLLLNRSLDFGPYFDLLFATYTTIGGRPLQVVLGLMQMLWDRSEPDGYFPYMTENTLPCASCTGGVTPSHVVLLNDAIGDFQVTPFAAHLMARTIGAQNIKPVNREIYGVPDADGPFAGSAITEFNFHLGTDGDGVVLPVVNISNNGPDNCDPHDNVRQESPVFDQTDAFFKQQVAQNFCTGAILEHLATDQQGTCDFDQNMGPSPEDILALPATPVECAPADGGTPPFWCSQMMSMPPSACNPG